MPGTSNTLGEKFVIEFVIMPVIRECCIQSPVKIDYLKLAKSPHYIPISLLAFMVAITEINIPFFNSIPWRDIALLKRTQYLQNYLCTVLEEEINKVETNAFKLQVIDEQISIVKAEDEQLHWDKILPRYRVSPALAKLMLNIITQRQTQNQRQKKYEEEKEEQIRSINKLHRQNLAQRNLKAELSNGVRYYCSNAPVKLVPDNLPETIWLQDLAHYLAISEIGYQKYGDVVYDNEQLLNNARGIHKILRETVNNILSIILNERCKMPPSQYEVARAGGVLDIAVVAILPEREIPDDWSVLVTKELALKILNLLPEFNYLFNAQQIFIDELINVQSEQHQANATPILVETITINDSGLSDPISNQKSLINDFTPTQYTGDSINTAVVQCILPELLPDKRCTLSDKERNDLCWNCFQRLAEVLRNNGYGSIDYEERRIRKESCIVIKANDKKTKNIDYDAFRKRFKTLLLAYRNNIPCTDK